MCQDNPISSAMRKQTYRWDLHVKFKFTEPVTADHCRAEAWNGIEMFTLTKNRKLKNRQQ